MTSPRGVNRRSRAALFDETDGMKTAEANGMGQPAGWRARDGVLWFPTQRGVVRIDPKQASSGAGSVADPIVELVSSDGAPRSMAGGIVLPAGRSDVEFRFTAPAFDKPERVQFRYRLEGHDRDWIDAGSRRLAHYANLPPGQYRFRRRRARQWRAVERAPGARHHHPSTVPLSALVGALLGSVGAAPRRG